ncbi:MAG: endolytic transglycosylase MltG [Steroidobacteraceae bacterium]
MNRRGKIGILLLLLLVLMTAATLGLRRVVQQAATRPGPSTSMQQFEVQQGSSLRSVLKALERQQLIGDARLLEWYLRCCQLGTPLSSGDVKAGRYRIVPGQPPIEIVRQLIEGRVALEKVTIVEGWSFAQMRAHLAQQPDLLQTLGNRSEAGIMEQLGAPGLPAEGRFAPDTYSYASGVTTDIQVLGMAFTAQQRNLQTAWEARQPDLPLATPDEALVLASIVEKETGLANERARVAGVFINRLRKGMRLQSDPTVIYGIGDRWNGNIRKRDLTADTPYNTYTRTGLPPTPIALPGHKALVATLNPEKTDSIFFVALGDGSGGHCFSATVAEHNRCVQRYLERLRAPSIAEEIATPAAAPSPAASATP